MQSEAGQFRRGRGLKRTMTHVSIHSFDAVPPLRAPGSAGAAASKVQSTPAARQRRHGALSLPSHFICKAEGLEAPDSCQTCLQQGAQVEIKRTFCFLHNKHAMALRLTVDDFFRGAGVARGSPCSGAPSSTSPPPSLLLRWLPVHSTLPSNDLSSPCSCWYSRWFGDSNEERWGLW